MGALAKDISSISRRVISNGVELYVEEFGDNTKPAVLFVHGYPDCHKTWSYQVESLSKYYHVITFDLRGVAKSTKPVASNGYYIDSILPDISAVIDATKGKQGQVHLVGHDWGSVLSWHYVAEQNFQKRILSYTSISGPHAGIFLDWMYRNIKSLNPKKIASVAGQLRLSWYMYAMHLPGFIDYAFKNNGYKMWKRLFVIAGVDPFDSYLRASPDEVESITRNAADLYRQNTLRRFQPPKKMSINIPVQLIVPTQDFAIRPEIHDYVGHYVSALSTQRIVANHWAHRTHPKTINTLIETFINNCEIGSTCKSEKETINERH